MTRLDRIIQFLTDEGFRPTQPEENVIQFQLDGGIYYVILDRADSHFYRIVFPNFHSVPSEEDRIRALRAANVANAQSKAGKVFLTADNAWAAAELFADQIDHFLAVFPRSISALRFVAATFAQEMAKSPGKPEESAAPDVPPPSPGETSITGDLPT